MASAVLRCTRVAPKRTRRSHTSHKAGVISPAPPRNLQDRHEHGHRQQHTTARPRRSLGWESLAGAAVPLVAMAALSADQLEDESDDEQGIQDMKLINERIEAMAKEVDIFQSEWPWERREILLAVYSWKPELLQFHGDTESRLALLRCVVNREPIPQELLDRNLGMMGNKRWIQGDPPRVNRKGLVGKFRYHNYWPGFVKNMAPKGVKNEYQLIEQLRQDAQERKKEEARKRGEWLPSRPAPFYETKEAMFEPDPATMFEDLYDKLEFADFTDVLAEEFKPDTLEEVEQKIKLESSRAVVPPPPPARGVRGPNPKMQEMGHDIMGMLNVETHTGFRTAIPTPFHLTKKKQFGGNIGFSLGDEEADGKASLSVDTSLILPGKEATQQYQAGYRGGSVSGMFFYGKGNWSNVVQFQSSPPPPPGDPNAQAGGSALVLQTDYKVDRGTFIFGLRPDHFSLEYSHQLTNNVKAGTMLQVVHNGMTALIAAAEHTYRGKQQLVKLTSVQGLVDMVEVSYGQHVRDTFWMAAGYQYGQGEGQATIGAEYKVGPFRWNNTVAYPSGTYKASMTALAGGFLRLSLCAEIERPDTYKFGIGVAFGRSGRNKMRFGARLDRESLNEPH